MSHELFVYLPYKVMRLPLYGIVEDIFGVKKLK